MSEAPPVPYTIRHATAEVARAGELLSSAGDRIALWRVGYGDVPAEAATELTRLASNLRSLADEVCRVVTSPPVMRSAP